MPDKPTPAALAADYASIAGPDNAQCRAHGKVLAAEIAARLPDVAVADIAAVLLVLGDEIEGRLMAQKARTRRSCGHLAALGGAIAFGGEYVFRMAQPTKQFDAREA